MGMGGMRWMGRVGGVFPTGIIGHGGPWMESGIGRGSVVRSSGSTIASSGDGGVGGLDQQQARARLITEGQLTACASDDQDGSNPYNINLNSLVDIMRNDRANADTQPVFLRVDKKRKKAEASRFYKLHKTSAKCPETVVLKVMGPDSVSFYKTDFSADQSLLVPLGTPTPPVSEESSTPTPLSS
jgi:hypothetical protein